MSIHSRCLGLLPLICSLWQFAADGWAQSYPAKPVRYLVHSSAGSGADTLGRIIAAELSQQFRQQVVVENRAGAAGNIAAEVATKAPPDGYTVLQVTTTHAINAGLYPNLAYDLSRDFAAVARVASAPLMMVAHPSLPVKSVGELVKLAKAKPGAINYASAGAGTIGFLAGELFKSLSGTNLLHVPYRGGGEALTSVMSGETSIYVTPIAPGIPLVQQGRLRMLGVTTPKRLAMLPDYPAVAEAVSGYEIDVWYGLMVPARTPRETIAAIRAATHAVLNTPAFNKRLVDLGYVVIIDTPEEFAAYIKTQVSQLTKIIRDNNLKPD